MSTISIETINWKGIKVSRETFQEIDSLIVFLLAVIDHSDKRLRDGRMIVIESAYRLGRVLLDVSDEAFVHSFQASVALQRFLAHPNENLRLLAKAHLDAIRTTFNLDELIVEKARNKK